MLPRWSPGTRELRRHRKNRVSRSERHRKRKSILERLEERRLLARDVSGTISADETWSETIRVTGNVTVADGVKLTINPGTVVKFESNRWLVGSGEVEALGTATQPIIFTSVQDDSVGEDLTPDAEGAPSAGDWEALFAYSGDWDVRHAEVRYAGSDGRYAALFVDESRDATENGVGVFQDLLISDSGNTGIDVVSGDPQFTRVDIVGSGEVAIHQRIAATPTYDSITASGSAAGDHLRHDGGTISDARVWDVGSLPIHVTGSVSIAEPGSLTVAPGSVVKLNSFVSIDANTGPLKAIGTSDSPIVFTSTSDDTVGGDSNADGDATTPSPGDWTTLFLRNRDTELSNVEIRYGAGDARYGSIWIRENATGTEGSNISLSDVRIRDGEHDGIEAESGNPAFQNVLITDHGGIAIDQRFASQPTYDGVTVRDNAGGDHIRLAGGTINTDRVWDFDGVPVHLSGAISIADPGSLTVAPGSVVKFGVGGSIDANTGPLKAIGTADSPIVFTATTDDTVGGDSNADGDQTAPSPGHWATFFLRNRDTELSNVEIRHAAGDARYGSLWINENTTGAEGSNVSLSNVRITDGEHDGIEAIAGRPIFQNVIITDHGGVAVDQQLASQPVYDGVTIRDNAGGDHVRLAGGTVNDERVWDFGGAPIHVTSAVTINAPGSLTVAAGSVVKFGVGGSVDANTGPLKAVGTAEAPIVFTATTDDTAGGDSNADGDATTPLPGHWTTFFLRHRDTVLSNVEIRYAARDARYGSIWISENASGAEGSNISLSDVRITDGLLDGIEAISGNPTFQNVVITDHGGVPIDQRLASQPVYDGITIRDNAGGDHILLAGGSFNNDRTWDFDGAPVHVASTLTINDPGSLTVVPGSVVKFGVGGSIDASSGPLKAIGTPEEPIVFTATTDDTVGGDTNADGDATGPLPGHWTTFFLRNRDTELSNVDIRYAGRDARYGSIWIGENSTGADDGNITLTNVSITSGFNDVVEVVAGSPVFDGFRSVGNVGRAIDVAAGAGVTVTDSDFFGGTHGVYLRNNATANVTGSSFIGQTEFAAFHAGTERSNAVFTGNYWGHPGGPHDPSSADGFLNDNPGGTPVTDFVDYGAFLSIPPRPIGPRALSLEKLPPVDPPAHHRYEAENTAEDREGTRNGTLVADAGFAAGRVGGSAFSLDGDGDYVNLGSWAPAGEWTLAAWVNPDTLAATDVNSIGLVGTQADFRDWSIGIFEDNYVAIAKGQILDSGVAATTGTWTHVAATLRGSMLHVYTDGVLRNSLDIGDPYVLSTRGVRIGSTTFNGAGFFDGRIDEVSIIERSVSDAEILTLRDSGTIEPFPVKDRSVCCF